MNGLEVGRLERVSHGELLFQYVDAWLADESSPPISLSLPLSAEPYSGEVVWNFFDNLLPNSDGIRSRMQRELGAESTRPFDLLETVGRDCVGALQLGGDPTTTNTRHMDARPVSDAWIADQLRNYRSRPLGMRREEPAFRISVAGAQEKTALLRQQGKWYEPLGATPTTHLLKLPTGPIQEGIDMSDSVENEWLCLQIAGAFGLPVPAAEMCEFEDVRVLVVERFDRRWSRNGSWILRLPQEDVCQALGISPGKKYESEGGPGIAEILDLLLQSQQPEEDRSTFFRAQIVFWLLAAIDGHAKNFSLFLRAGGRCRMTPIYDVLSAHPVLVRKQLRLKDVRMAMAVRGKNRHYRWSEIQGRYWPMTARAAGFSEERAAQVLEDCVARAPGVVEEVSRALPPDFPDAVSTPIFEGIEGVLKRAEPLSD